MNTEPTQPPSSQTPPPLPPPSPEAAEHRPPPASAESRKTQSGQPDPMDFRPLEKQAGFFQVIESLLKQPGCILHECRQGGLKIPGILIICTIVCLGVFGLLLGSFSGGVQLWAAPVKVIGGALAAMLICFPSLYIFSALSGVDAKVSHIAGILIAAVSLTALLLLGFSPVVWIFSQSTESAGFMGFLALVFWLISLSFGFRLLSAAAERIGMTSHGYIFTWIVIFLVVTLQMSTSLRPIIGAADTFLPEKKKFFLEHWMSEMGNHQEEGSKDRQP